MQRATAALALSLPLVPITPLAGQNLPDDPREPVPSRFLLRAGAGALNTDDPFVVTLAVHAEVGFEWGERRALTVRYLRQSARGNESEDLGETARGLLSAALEWGFGDVAPRVQQYRVRLGGGAVFRPDRLSTAPAVEMAAVIRYPLVGRLAVTGLLGDVIALLPRDEFVNCVVTGPPPCAACPPPATCTTYVVGDKVEHNFGLLVALEWRP